MRIPFYILLILPYCSEAQLEINDTLILSGNSNNARVINNIADSNDSLDAINVSTVIYKRLIYANANSSTPNTIELSLTPSLTHYTIGQRINFFSPLSNSDAVTVQVDNLFAVPLVRSDGMPLDSLNLATGLLVSAVFDGSQFLIVSEISKQCPSGYEGVNDFFCIEQNDHPAVDFWQAIVTCGDENARLCTWDEWYAACSSSNTAINDMVNNWEYIDSSQNFTNTTSSGVVFWLISSASSMAQITVDNSIDFVNPDDSKRQVINYGNADDLLQAVNAQDVFDNRLSIAHISLYNNNIIDMNLPVAPSNYILGMEINFISTITCNDSAQLNLNGLGIIPITKNLTEFLDSGDIHVGMPVSLIYDGSNFQLITQSNACPQGYISVDHAYCIEQNERPTSIFWDAVKTCHSTGGAICSITEWYFACQNTSLGLSDMSNNWEWVSHGNDHGQESTIVGGDPIEGCKSSKSQNVTPTNTGASRTYRCCFYR